mmetsp:Transcript_24214/g.66593  ORF Transcript_24214/g.66593 Transcript_24214/m.66593 type:complete len:298 (-) Transcript_24214:1635-2528(-)
MQPGVNREASRVRESRLRSTTRSFGGARASIRKEQKRLLLRPIKLLSAALVSPSFLDAVWERSAALASSSEPSLSDTRSSLSLSLRSCCWPRPKKSFPRWHDAALGSAGLPGVAVVAVGVLSPGAAPRSMFCFARFRRFIISSAASFFSGSALSGWYSNDLCRQARVISLAVAVACTPKMTWSGSSQIVFTRACKVLKPFCLLSIVWPSQNTRTHATYTCELSSCPMRCIDSEFRTGPCWTSVAAEPTESLVPEAYTVSSNRSPVNEFMRKTTAVSNTSTTSSSGSRSSCLVLACNS